MGLLLLQGASDLNPRELFANGEQGLWLDPSQMSTLYQDSNGVTPCTAAGDPVGLILDQSRGGLSQIGPELIINGTFNTDLTGWTLSQTAGATLPAYDAGAIKLVSDGSGFSRADQSFTTVIGATYFLEFSFTYPGAGAGVVKVGTTASNGSEVSVSESTSGNKKYRFVAAATTTWIRLETGSNNATGYKFDNVTVRLVPGNHAYQSSSSARPTLARIPSSGRRNLLTRTEEFDNAAWVKTSATISANAGTAPDGLVKADKFIPGNAITANNASVASSTITASPSQTWTFTFKAKADGQTSVQTNIQLIGAAGNYRGSVNLSTGVYSNIISTGWATPSAIVTDLGSGWYQISITGTTPASTTGFACLISNNATGNGTDGVLITDAQAEQSATATNYQKVVATTDVTESGVSDLWHLVFDGSDDSLVTNAVDFTATDEMTVIAGLRKLSDASYHCICESSADVNSNNGSFNIFGSATGGGTVAEYAFGSRGTTTRSADTPNTFAAPITNVVTGLGKISTDTCQVRINGAFSAENTGDQGSGNYGNHIIYIGRRNSASLPFNGHIYQLIIRGKTTPTGKLLEAERFVGRKTGVSF